MRNFVLGGLWASGPPWGRNFAEICVSGGRWASGPPWGRNFAEILVLGGLWASGPPWGRNFAEFCVLGSLRRISSLPGPKMADFRPPGPQDDGFPVSGAAPETQTGGFPASPMDLPGGVILRNFVLGGLWGFPAPPRGAILRNFVLGGLWAAGPLEGRNFAEFCLGGPLGLRTLLGVNFCGNLCLEGPLGLRTPRGA